MSALLGKHGFVYGRLGLAAVAVGMGFHLASGTLNQAALARGRAALAAVAWRCAAAFFVAFVAAPTIRSEVTRVEAGYLIATAILCGLLAAVYARGPASAPAAATA
jgi:hypothetical protein